MNNVTNSSKKVLIVGGAGYVGSILTSELLDRGYAVKILDRLYFGRSGLKDLQDRVELVVGDMRTISPDILRDVNAVVNIGGLSNDPTAEYNPKANHEMNTVAVQMLAELCKKHGVKRYVFGSTCSIYDQGVGDDAKDNLLDENSEVNPRSAYASSKYLAERALLAMTDDNFCPVMLRKGTIYGFSPRMRYDLVVNTFVRDALAKGFITIHYGGEMWRPLVEVRDAARAYIACIEAPEEKVKGEIFNLASGNYRISELALRVREVLRAEGVPVDIKTAYTYQGVRSYRVLSQKIQDRLGVKPVISIQDSVRDMLKKIQEYGYTEFDNPRYYNIRWMKLLEEAKDIIAISGEVF